MAVVNDIFSEILVSEEIIMDVDVKQGVNLSSHYRDDHFKWKTIHTVPKMTY